MGKFAGAAKEMAVAWRYGVSDIVDGYVFVFNLLNWPISVWFSVLTIVLIPIIIDAKKKCPEDLQIFIEEFFGFSLICGVIVGCAFGLVLPAMLVENWMNLENSITNEALKIVVNLSLIVPFGFVIGYFSILMMINGSHSNTLLEAIPATLILFSLVLPREWLDQPLILGTVVGFLAHLIVLLLMSNNKKHFIRPRITMTASIWKNIWPAISITIAGQLVMSLSSIVDQIFMARLGSGTLSSFGYANKIMALILGVGALAISRATLPIFSEKINDNVKDAYQASLFWSKTMMVLSCAIVVIVWFGSELIVSVLFERGEFTGDDTKSISILLKYSLLQLPLYMAGLVLVSVLSGAKKYIFIASTSFVNLTVKVILNSLLVDKFGVHGIIISTVVMIAVSAIISYVGVIMEISKLSKSKIQTCQLK